MAEEMLHELGAFEPSDARRVIAMLEGAGIPFEVEADHSELAKPGRWLHLYFGMYPEGSKLALFVPASKIEYAQAELQRMFPV